MEQPNSNVALLAMREARRLFYSTRGVRMLTRQELYDAVISLNEWRFFSYKQLSQISGVSLTKLRGMIHNNVAAGKFNPKSLDTLIQLRLNKTNNRPVNSVLVQAALKDGNSPVTITRCTGITAAEIKRALRDNQGVHIQ